MGKRRGVIERDMIEYDSKALRASEACVTAQQQRFILFLCVAIK